MGRGGSVGGEEVMEEGLESGEKEMVAAAEFRAVPGEEDG